MSSGVTAVGGGAAARAGAANSTPAASVLSASRLEWLIGACPMFCSVRPFQSLAQVGASHAKPCPRPTRKGSHDAPAHTLVGMGMVAPHRGVRSGTRVLAVAVTGIAGALIRPVMFAQPVEKAGLPRDTVFAPVMI